MKKMLFSLFFSLLMAGSATAQVYCTNQTNAGAWIAVAYHHITDMNMTTAQSPYVTEGWLYVAPYDTIQVGSHLGWDKQLGCKSNYYFYAYQPGGRNWSGTRYFMVDTQPANVKPDQFAFRLEYANKTGISYKNTPSIQPLGFKKGTNQNGGVFLIVLRMNDENDPPVTPEEKNFFEPNPKKYGQTEPVQYDH